MYIYQNTYFFPFLVLYNKVMVFFLTNTLKLALYCRWPDDHKQLDLCAVMNVLFIKEHYVYADAPAEVADGYGMKQRLSFILLRSGNSQLHFYKSS